MAEARICGATNGDSGAPIYKRKRALGVLKGGYVSPSCAEQTVAFTPARTVEQLLDVIILGRR